jgi:hypothetical protein
MSQTDFIPRPDAAFDAFFRNLTDYVIDNRARWGHIPQDDVNGLELAFDDWHQAYNKTLVPHIPQLTAEMRRVRAVQERALRAFVNRFLRWPPVTDLDRDKMGVRNWDTVRTEQPVPATVPEMEFVTSVIREITIRYRDFGAPNWAKPEHVHGIEIRWAILESRPDTLDALVNVEIDTANPLTLTFDESERGQRIFVVARWYNNTAHAGPWSDIESAFIP